jgi:hypothetical protein
MGDGSFEPYKAAAASSDPCVQNPKNLNPKQDMVFLSKQRFVLITFGHQESIIRTNWANVEVKSHK